MAILNQIQKGVDIAKLKASQLTRITALQNTIAKLRGEINVLNRQISDKILLFYRSQRELPDEISQLCSQIEKLDQEIRHIQETITSIKSESYNEPIAQLPDNKDYQPVQTPDSNFENLDEIQKAIELIKSGDKSGARTILISVIKKNPRNELAWSWLYSAVETDERKIYCLKEILKINPNNTNAARALRKLENKYQPPMDEDSTHQEKNEPVTASRSQRKTTNVQKRESSNNDEVTNPKFFTPKRIITALGMFLISASAFLPWKTSYTWNGAFGIGKYNSSVTTGFSTLEGLVAISVGILGIVLIFSMKQMKVVNIICLVGAIIMTIMAFSYLQGAGVQDNYNSFYDRYNFYSVAGMGVYMSIVGSLITLGGLFAPSQNK